MTGPLSGIRILELASIGPGPFAGMMLADHGAEVIRIVRPSTPSDPNSALLRSRASLELDLKKPADIERLLDLVETADAIFEGYRPGTLERLGIGPDILHARNPRLVIGRMTGWGQTGSYAMTAGHDINYIALTGALHAIGTPETPLPPLALVGDFGGGGMVLAFSLLAALLLAPSTQRSMAAIYS
jgi:alpha-methylacyl-CoA racemase